MGLLTTRRSHVDTTKQFDDYPDGQFARGHHEPRVSSENEPDFRQTAAEAKRNGNGSARLSV